MNDINRIKQLLEMVNNISSSYERISGLNENFNIFSVLRIETNEVTTHSRFLAELLNPNGCHGYKGRFLKLFLDNVLMKYDIDSDECEVIPEYYTGVVTETTGGNIDILIREKGSTEKVVMIENKIFAGEQPNQLLRYSNAFPKGRLLFLTLWGYESEMESSEKVNYKCISYRDNIMSWLEECQKEAVNSPLLRETITQYMNLVKELTHQNTNKEMRRELAKLFTSNQDNFDAFSTILNLKDDLKSYAVNEIVLPAFEELKNEIEGFNFPEGLKGINGKYSSLCWVENEKLKQKNLRILFEFQKQNADYLIGGFNFIDKSVVVESDYENLKKNFKVAFSKIPSRDNSSWIFFEYWNYMNWNSRLDDLKRLIFDDFKSDIKEKITLMLGLLNQSFNQNEE